MANKYFIFGATNNGDGTSPAEAESNGAAGAWNQETIFTNTAPAYGSLAAGDVVYIRSKTGNGANADKTVTLGASVSLGSTNATATAPIVWVLDNGAVWSGVDGTLTYACPSSYAVTFRANNHFEAQSQDKWVFKETNTSASNKNTVSTEAAVQLKNLYVDLNLGAGSYGSNFNISSGILRSVHVRAGKHYSPLFPITNAYEDVVLINCDIELTDATNKYPVFTAGNYGSFTSVYGGQIRGEGATTGKPVADLSNGMVRIVGMQFPQTMTAQQNSPWAVRSINCVGVDGVAGGLYASVNGILSSRNDGNFPTLNATLPLSSATPWSWYAYPAGATRQHPLRVVTGKLYTSAAAAKTVTLEFLLGSTWTTAHKGNVILDVIYVDNATGLPKSVTTKDPTDAAFDVSSAAWSATTYGAVSFNKKKLVITTPTAIKQDTMVVVVVSIGVTAVDTSKLLFVDPDVQLT